jgi:hypothetical protein
MPTGLPCPNPTCAEVFPPEALRGATSLACPRCGTVFEFRAPEAPKLAARPAPPVPRAGPAKPASKRVPVAPLPPVPAVALPVASPLVPSAPAIPLALPVAQEALPAGPAFGGPGVVAPRGGRRRRRRVGAWLILGLLAVVAGGVIALAVGMWLQLSDEADDLAAAAPRYNFEFRLPRRGWKRDREVEDRLRVPLALSRSNPRSTLALYFRDYKTREPGQAELLDEALKLLRDQFKPLQYQDPFTVKPEERGARLGDEPAWVVEFVGTDRGDQVPMAGECYMLARRGFAYWFLTWGPTEERDQLAPRWEAARQGFRLLGGRAGWKEQPPEVVRFVGTGGRYRLDYAKDRWEKYDKPADYDEAADLVLRGFEPAVDERTGKTTKVRLAGRMGTLKVLLLPAEKDLKSATAAARARLLEQAQKDYPEGAVEVDLEKDPASGKPVLDRDGDVGAFRGHLSRLRVALDKDHERSAYLAVVNLPDRVLAVVGECGWERRDYWRREFEQVLDTLAKPPLKGR